MIHGGSTASLSGLEHVHVSVQFQGFDAPMSDRTGKGREGGWAYGDRSTPYLGTLQIRRYEVLLLHMCLLGKNIYMHVLYCT